MSGSPGRRLAGAAVAAALALAVAACQPAPGPGVARAAVDHHALAEDDALAAARDFLDTWVDDDGRVVRRDQGGDTVSEGQAYGMLLAAGIGDRDAFDRIWAWTQQHLVRDDGLLAWLWRDGEVVDPAPAADADLDAAHALALASVVFADPDLARDAARTGRALLAHEVVDGPVAGRDGPVLVAGPWAVPDGWVNPSYASPVAHDVLGELTGDPAWDRLTDTGVAVAEASSPGDLVPDWARLADGAVEARPGPSDDQAHRRIGHGFDAMRTTVRHAVACAPAAVRVAAAVDDDYDRASRDGVPAGRLGLDGSVLDPDGHPLASVAAAAASLAAGDRDDAARLLALATEQVADAPTYYGAAWLALGRLWLSTERLGGCARQR